MGAPFKYVFVRDSVEERLVGDWLCGNDSTFLKGGS